MKRRWRAPALAVLGAAIVAGPTLAAEPDSEELAEMRALVERLEARIDAQDEQLEHQGEVLQTYRTREEREASSGLDSFLSDLEFGGWVAASYFYNFNNPGDGLLFGGNQGGSGLHYPFHPDHNSFAVDQVWFEMESPISAEKRAGFRVDLLYGKTAALLGSAVPLRRGGVIPDPDCVAAAIDADDGDLVCTLDTRDSSDVYINQAYVQYLIPIGDGVTVKAGKFATLLGAEVAQSPYNWNITRGIVYNLLQPLDHVGVLFDGTIGPIELAAGVVNGFTGNDPDFNNQKSFLGRIGTSGEKWAAGVSLIWGTESANTDDDTLGVVDVLLSWDPLDNFGTWLNFDYAWADNKFAPDNDGWGIAWAARYGFLERAGAAVRLEYAEDCDGFFGYIDSDRKTKVFAFTGTLDYELAENLTAKWEIRYDMVNKRGASNDEFIKNQRILGKDDQVVTGVELVYQF